MSIKKILNSPIFILIFIGLWGLSSCENQLTTPKKALQYNQSNKGIVATAHPLASKTAANILSQGGNAVDAAVAAAFTLSVVEPSMSGIGGRNQLLIGLENGEIIGIDGSTQTPRHYKPQKNSKRYGYQSIAVPGVVKALTKALREYGTLPLEIVMKDAIKLAREGHQLIQEEYDRQQSVSSQLAEFPESKKLYLNAALNSSSNRKKWVQKDLANVLESIAKEGEKVFYEGWIAKAMVADIQKNGGFVTLDDLKNYQALDATVVKGNYKGHEINGLFLPAYGAITIQMLNLLEILSSDNQDPADWVEDMFNSIKLAYQDRQKQKSISHISEITGKKVAEKKVQNFLKNHSQMIQNAPSNEDNTKENTTHLTVVDKNGMIVSLTQTVGSIMGSKVVSPGLGFVYAQSLGGYLGRMKPLERNKSHISPIIIKKNRESYMALGAAGGSRIPSAIVAIISRVIDEELGINKALASPRVFYNKHAILLEQDTENHFNQATKKKLEQKGYVLEIEARKGHFGRVQVIKRGKKAGFWEAGSDPDWQGSVAIPN